MNSDSPIREMQSKLEIWQADFKDPLQNPKHKCSWGMLHPKLHSNRKTEKKRPLTKKVLKQELRIYFQRTRESNSKKIKKGSKIKKTTKKKKKKIICIDVRWRGGQPNLCKGLAQQRSAWEWFQQQYQWESLQNKSIKKIGRIGRNHQM